MSVPVVLSYSVLAGLATVLGGLIVLAMGRQTERSLAIFLGLAAGIMLGVVVLDLLPSAWTHGNPLTTVVGFLLGLLLLFVLDLLLSGTAPASPLVRDRRYLLNMGYLIAAGIALHDLPEGMAIAVGWAATSHLGWMIALAIGLHNIPEGMATAAPLLMGGMHPVKTLAVNALVSVFTPLGTLLGLVLVGLSRGWIGALLSLAAGAMSYIVRYELIPESRRRHPNYARLGCILGFLIILALAAVE